ncbi:sensor domain-containing diguanylate cyclase [Leptonema illini]|uniref:diguanylate cyclase n=1 Tax=Leptonema illini DSM 21528 TaxID=929563 RepID=H2CA31_9LEPT|nr:sensor domain-containing diguanylate cyclase [Leptonema illini]EHQ05155.1 diguanylate cyclase with GAF sensor [Leptonema illini DSM 21528]
MDDSQTDGADHSLLHLYASIGKLITSSLDFRHIVEGVMKEIQTFFNPTHWSLMRVDANSDELFFVVAEGIDLKRIENIRLKTGEGIAGYVAQTGEPVFVPDARSDDRFSRKVDEQTGFETRSVMAVPLRFRERVYGVIELINRYDGGGYTHQDFIVIQTIADFAAIAFANAMLYEETRDLAHRDPLTGVFNRRRLEDLRAEWTGRRSEDRGCALAVIDLDNFKAINDGAGHQAGDRALCYIAHYLQLLIRGTDRIFRIGGDEFLVLIQNSSPDKLPEILGRLEASLNRLQERCGEHDPAFAFSYGLSTGRLDDLDSVMHQADLDMYSRKKNGGVHPRLQESADS